MRKIAYLLVIAVVLCAAPVFAQGPFNDVPTDHWAYDAVNTLQKDGIVIGYPDGTFGGKRAMSRYEFAVAIARLVTNLPSLVGTQPATGNFATKEELNAVKGMIPNTANFATKADVDALRRLIDEFRDEIAALGVDVDALKRDVAALGARVEALEAEVRRVKITGNANVFAITETAQRGLVVDQDNRLAGPAAAGTRFTLGRDIAVVKDFDLNIVGRVNATTSAVATINYGNYLNYLSSVDDYVGGTRPINVTNPAVGTGLPVGGTLDDFFFPYYAYIDAGLCKGSLSVGRFPIQFTPYTLKKIDVDSYTSIVKTDDGNYPVDGARLGLGFGGVDVTLFAVKNDTNAFLANGLTGLPTAGLYDPFLTKVAYGFHDAVQGHAVGALTSPITQTAGARATLGIPWKGNLGLTFYQAWSETAYFTPSAYDQARVYGGDLTIPLGSKFGIAGSYTKSDTLARQDVAVADIDGRNAAWDAKLTGSFGKLGVAAGYKNIDRNFAAAGFWDKIGRWTNPVDVKGPYADITYPITRRLRVDLNGEWLKLIDPITAAPAVWGASASDIVAKAEGGLRWGFSQANSLDLGYEWIAYNPDTAGLAEARETYLTIGWAHAMGANSGFKIAYQLINYDDGRTGSGPYSNGIVGANQDYRGGLGVVQFGVNF